MSFPSGIWVDGSPIVAWKKSLSEGAPFTKIVIGDLDKNRLEACKKRLEKLNAPVFDIHGEASTTVLNAIESVNKNALNFAFLDPFNLKTLNFEIFRELSKLKRIDILVHFSQMDLQRNLWKHTDEEATFDVMAPGWRKVVDIGRGQDFVRQSVFEYWRNQIAILGIAAEPEMKLIKGTNGQPLYWLLIAAKHELAKKFWNIAIDNGQEKLF